MSTDTDALEQTLQAARAVADTMLYEGYVLYPYRASSAKNRVRWQFGVLVPPGYRETDPSEHSSCRTECLVEPRRGARLTIVLRFLHVRERRSDRPGEPACWQEGHPETVTASVSVTDLAAMQAEEHETAGGHTTPEGRTTAGQAAEQVIAFEVPGGRHDDAGTVRQWWPLDGVLRVAAEPAGGPYGALRLRIVTENRTRWPAGAAGEAGSAPAGAGGDGGRVLAGEAGREAALRHSLVAAHLVLTLEQGTFLSLTDPPEWARPAAWACRNEHTWPVLIGPPDRPRVVLSSPIILEDFPQVAPESPGHLYDATEIDEILTLRTLALTDEEKEEARATDERAAAVIDRVDTMPPEIFERLHGAVRHLAPRVVGPAVPGTRAAAAQPHTGPAGAPGTGPEPFPGLPSAGDPTPWWDPGADTSVSPESDRAMLATGETVGRGSRVRLCPGARRSDAQDLFLVGRSATVQAVLFDVDGATHLAVTLDDDPAAELKDAYGRYLYFRTDEVEPLHEPREGAP